MADRAAGDIPEVRLTLTQRLRRVEGLVHRFSEILNLLIAHGRRRNWTLSLITGVAVGFVLGLLGFIPIPEVAVDWRLPARAASEYAPALSVNAGEEVAFVFVGSSNCGWSNVRELPNMVKGLKLELRKRAENLGMSFAAVGIARDIIATNGIRHLEKFGDFDEVMSGRGWANIGVLKYVYGDQLSGPAATPQVLVVERSLDDTAGHIALTAERVVARKTGLDEITQWVQSGAPTPLLGRGGSVHDR